MTKATFVPVFLFSTCFAVVACSSSGSGIRPSPDTVAASGAAGATGQGGAGTPGAGGGGADASAGAGGDPSPPKDCPPGRGPVMARIALAEVPAYCIDTTEVTQGQYAEFVAAAVEPSGQSREICRQINPSFVPVVEGDHVFGCKPGEYDPEKRRDTPVGCVQFCDAVAYCEWAGKRLCGAVGGGAAEAVPASRKSQWYLACSQGGKTRYPYGDAYEGGKCDNHASGAPYALQPASKSTCTGSEPPFDQIKDLSGNVAEWEDAESDTGIFHIRGNFRTSEEDLFACDQPATTPGVQTLPNIGFRCCADL